MRRPADLGDTATVIVVLLLLATPLLFAIQLRHDGADPHRAVLAVAGPPIVAQEIAERAGTLPGDPFEGRAVGSPAEARKSVGNGAAAAGIVIDFRLDHDTLLVSPTTDPDLVADYQARIGAVSAGFGRVLRVETVPLDGSLGGPDAGAGLDQGARRAPYVVTFVALFAGVGLAVLLSLCFGPIAGTRTRSAVRLAALAGAAAVVGVAAAATTNGAGTDLLLPRALAVALLTVVAAWSVQALESVLGLRGLALATAALLGAAAPLLAYVAPVTLPDPWRQIVPLTPHGAALDLSTDLLYFATSSARSWAILSAWALLAVLTLMLARRHRPH